MRLYIVILGLGLSLPVWLGAEPVDTNQFGFIRLGAPESSVLERLGPPDSRQVLQRYLVSASTGRGTAISEIREKVVLIYQGDSTTMTAYITIDNGRVVHKDKRR